MHQPYNENITTGQNSESFILVENSLFSGNFIQGEIGYNTLLHEIGHVFGMVDPGLTSFNFHDSIMVAA